MVERVRHLDSASPARYTTHAIVWGARKEEAS